MGNELVRPLRALKPKDDTIKVMSYLEAQSAGGFLQAPVAHFQTNLFLRELSDGAIAAITTAINHAPGRCKVIIVPLRGAVSRVNLTDTAFALRQPGYEVDMTGVWSTPAEKADAVLWVQAARDSLQPFAHGVYVNQLGDTSDQLVRSGYGSNYARLVEIGHKRARAKMKKLPFLKRRIGDINCRRYPAWQLASAIHNETVGFPDVHVFR
jgi:hypothetical protein